ncbi:restriction endonuclease subunit S [Psychrobacter sp. I-STPA10]|uniref:restriction endonuclease subunit S n=1 Tax=Psychrobacter sp. I-STPA10 TaxID=2585769 RepID=UPI001E443DA1|nr:restriction endonuclease subunit S [Psychrobacter sp. I-STPA10]
MVIKKKNQNFVLTDFGYVPDDWKQYKLETVADVIDPHPSHRAPPELKNGIPFLGIGDLDEKGETIKGEVRRVGKYVLHEHAQRYDFKDGLIGLGRVASIGKVVKFNKLQKDITISPTLGLIKPNNIQREYLVHFLKSDYVNSQFRQIMSGSTRSSVGMQVLRRLIVLKPSESEQTAIATALSDIDELITSLKKLIAKKQAIKMGTMQQLLTGKTRLPQFAIRKDGSPKGYKKTELGLIPEDWDAVELGHLLSYEQPTKYIIKDNIFHESGTTPILTAGKSFILGYTEEIDGIYTNTPVIIFDDFTTATQFVDFKFKVKSSAIKILKPKQACIPIKLLYLLLSSINFEVGDHKRHWISEFHYLKVSLPSNPNEQTAIATILSDMDAEIQALQDRLDKTYNIKQGMMQQLLTGRVRLINPKTSDAN